MAGQAAAQPFSMHARGVHTYETSPLLDFSYQFRVMLRELRNVSGGFLMFLFLQSWLAVFVVCITIGSVAFYTYVGTAGEPAVLSWVLVCFVVLLPLTLLTYMGWQRRETALSELANVKVMMLHIYWSFEDSAAHRPIVQDLLLSLTGLMRTYLDVPRFYATQYPVTGITEKMTAVAQVRAKQMQQATLIFRNLARCPDADAMGQRQAGLVMQLQQTFERLAIIKEYRLPQGLRTLVRLYVVLVIPIFFGPYYAEVSQNTQSFVFVLFFAVMMHLGMVGVLNAALSFEDPFSTEGVDGVYCDEILFEVEQVLLPGGHLPVQLNGLQHSSPGKMPTAVQPPANSLAAHGRPDQHAVDMASLQPLPGDSIPAD